MREVILSFPSQFSIGAKTAKDIQIKQEFNNVIFCGMGGSALPGEILKTLNPLYNWPINIQIYRDYHLPSQASPKSLIFVISCSGNTEEAISSYIQAKKDNLHTVVITTGGKLAELCKQDKTPIVNLPKKNIQPRQAIGYQFGAIAKILSASNITPELDNHVWEAVKYISPKKTEKQGEKIAKEIKGKTPLIYASTKYSSLSYIWKTSFNENSKSPAFCNNFPELNHNEMEGIAHKTECEHRQQPIFHLLILRDKNSDHPRILKRMQATKKLLQKKSKIKTTFIDLKQKDPITKIFSNYILSQWSSYYLAREYSIDPSPVNTIEEFKQEI